MEERLIIPLCDWETRLEYNVNRMERKAQRLAKEIRERKTAET